MDARLRQIVPKGPGVYFIVTDNSQIGEIEDESRLRVIFINSEQGPVNCLVKFAQYDYDSFTATFGKPTRTKEKRGDFGHKVCLDALQGGPIGVINLRTFDDSRDLAQIATINPSTKLPSVVRNEKVPYTSMFDKNGFWTPRKENLTEKFYETEGFLNFGNISNNDLSIYVIKASENDVALLTDEYDETLESCSLEITDFPGLNWDSKLKDSFVKVYIFKNTFRNAHSNSSYGQYFDNNDKITVENLELLKNVTAASFVGSYVGSVIPELKNEKGEDISIDVLMYQDYLKTGVLCDINNELLETETTNNGMIDLFGVDSYNYDDTANTLSIDSLLSYSSQSMQIEDNVPAIPSSKSDNIKRTIKNVMMFGTTENDDKSFKTNSSTGIKILDYVVGEDRLVQIKDIVLGETTQLAVEEQIFDSLSERAFSRLIMIDDSQGDPYYLLSVYRENKPNILLKSSKLSSSINIDWSIVEGDYNVSDAGNPIVFKSSKNNMFEEGPGVLLVGFCEAENCNYVIRYNLENGTITKTKLSQECSKNISIIPGLNNSIIIKGDKWYYQSTDGISFNAKSINDDEVIISMIDTNDSLIALTIDSRYIDANNLPPAPASASANVEISPYIHIKSTTDGIVWNNVSSDYSNLAGVVNVFLSNVGNDEFKNDLRKYFSDLYVDNYGYMCLITADFKIITINANSINDSSGYWDLYDIENSPTNPQYFGNISRIRGNNKSLLGVNISENENFENSSFIEIDTDPGSPIAVINTLDIPPVIVDNNLTALMTSELDSGLVKHHLDSFFLYAEGYAVSDVLAFSPKYNVEYTPATYVCDGNIKLFGNDVMVVKPYTQKSDAVLSNFVLQSYKPSEDQFLNGSPSRQEEILNQMLNKGITRGLRGVTGIAYFVDAFKSFVIPSYKKQFGQLNLIMHEGNRFTRAIINEPFITDMLKSTNPLLKENPSDDVLSYEQLAQGGNKEYSRTLITKFTDNEGAGYCFFVGPGDIINGIVKPITGLISNLFVNKTNLFDVAANETGYISGITEIEENFDESEDLKFLQKFRYNPVMFINNGYTLYGNLSGQKTISKQQQWHNVELLCLIKENLYNMARPSVFKKGTYDEYLATQTNTEEFLNTLVVAGALKSDFVVKCDLENNTPEIQSYKIKLVHVEYTPYDCLEKVVFDININN